MLYGLLLVVHVIVAVFLIGVILLQGGRGGMGEALSGQAAQSLFGGGANTVMTKVTAVGASLFMVTCLSLAILSKGRAQSIMDQSGAGLPIALPQPPEAPPFNAPRAPISPVDQNAAPTPPAATTPTEPAP